MLDLQPSHLILDYLAYMCLIIQFPSIRENQKGRANIVVVSDLGKPITAQQNKTSIIY